MNSLLTLFVATVCVVSVSANWEANPIITSAELLRDLRALRQKVVDTGCDVNLCFALDGSGSITTEQFQVQKDFADLIINIIATDSPGNFCAVQYGTWLSPISALTGNKQDFIRQLHHARKVGGGTNIAAALGYTGFQLRPRIEDANKIVLLGDGLDNIGFSPRFVSSMFRQQGIEISTVAVGKADRKALEEITNDPGRVLEISNFFELSEIIVDVINGACGFY